MLEWLSTEYDGISPMGWFWMGLRYVSAVILLAGIAVSHIYPIAQIGVSDAMFERLIQENSQRILALESAQGRVERLEANQVSHAALDAHPGGQSTFTEILVRLTAIDSSIWWLTWLMTGVGVPSALMAFDRFARWKRSISIGLARRRRVSQEDVE